MSRYSGGIEGTQNTCVRVPRAAGSFAPASMAAKKASDGCRWRASTATAILRHSAACQRWCAAAAASSKAISRPADHAASH